MARLLIKDIDEKLFWDLANSGIVGDWSLHIVSDYLYMIAEKLTKDTDIRFRVEDYNIVNESLGISIPSTECTSYDNILKIIEKSLGETAKENPYDINTNKLASTWGYTFSNTSSSAYYEGNARWHAYDEYEQPPIFEVLYFGCFGEFHKDLGFAHDMKKRYLVQDQYNQLFHFKGSIPELDNIFVIFAKNGNISVKNPSKEFLEKVEFFYRITDPKKKNHEKF